MINLDPGHRCYHIGPCYNTFHRAQTRSDCWQGLPLCIAGESDAPRHWISETDGPEDGQIASPIDGPEDGQVASPIDGPEDGQVASPVYGDAANPQLGSAEPDRQSQIYELAERLLAEADRTKEEAILGAETEAGRIRADAEEKARKQILEPAEAEAAVRAEAIIAEAEQQAQRTLASASLEAQEIIQAAKQKAAELESQAGTKVRMLAERVTDELATVLASINHLAPAAESSADRLDDDSNLGNGHAAEHAQDYALQNP